MRRKFDSSIPRKMYWSNEIKNKKLCPECNSKLEKEYHSYLIITKTKDDNDFFIIGNDGGYFCPKCPIVVLDHKTFSEIISASNVFSRSFKFTVAGIVDIEGMSPNKSHIPLSDDDNPILLVKFIRE